MWTCDCLFNAIITKGAKGLEPYAYPLQYLPSTHHQKFSLHGNKLRWSVDAPMYESISVTGLCFKSISSHRSIFKSVSAHRSMITSVSAHRSMFESASDADHRSKFESDFRSQISLWIFLRSQTYVWTCFGWAFSWSCDSWILPNDFAHLNWWTEKLAHITSRPDMKSFWWWQFKLHICALSSLPPGTAVPVSISWGQISTEASALSSEPHHP